MNVIPLIRFTQSDLALFDQVAYPRISRGIWSHIDRHTCSDGDQVLVYFPHVQLPVFRFERDCSGTYTLWYRPATSADWGLITTGTSAAECLSIWNGDSRKGDRA
jgi:hypothetical protein